MRLEGKYYPSTGLLDGARVWEEPQEGERWAPGVSSVFRISPGVEIILEKSLGFVC